ncbi:helix-turn-helix domain-containing protein [Variovorax sp. LjRoot178]|uniref:helix-turn-helix domain-containing protein n=1 Tax=Variovorax sp. LjRoot178 TaxID=3342277 RepID=UPI003F514C59
MERESRPNLASRTRPAPYPDSGEALRNEDASGSRVGPALTQGELGGLLGARRQRVTRVLHLLERAGAISLAHRISTGWTPRTRRRIRWHAAAENKGKPVP